ncbi:MAG: hypothetical protein E7597_04905 [Ruminococcaceae bacterium]|nr:hypothetical protein [Oscillospiraceae bacterium]
MRNSFLKATAVFLCLSILTGVGTFTAFGEEVRCTVYSVTDFHCKFEIIAPANVTVGEEFEIAFRWSEYDFDTCVSAFAVQFYMDTRYVILAGNLEDTVTIVGSESPWTDCSNYGGGIGLGAVEASDKSVPCKQMISVSFSNDDCEACTPDQFTVKVRFKAVYSGQPEFDWLLMEFYDDLFTQEIYSDMENCGISITVTGDADGSQNNVETYVPLKGDVNGDDKTDNLDAAWILKHNAKLIIISDGCLTLADVNGDGEVNSLDASWILRYDAGLIETL